jgi:sarcosine oxidase
VDWGDPSIYGLPSPGQGIKVGEHIAGPTTDPEDEVGPDPAAVERLDAWVAERYPGAEATAHYAETCIYTNTPDEHFVLEHHGRIVVGSPCSGHGFKFAPLIGRRLAALAGAVRA